MFNVTRKRKKEKILNKRGRGIMAIWVCWISRREWIRIDSVVLRFVCVCVGETERGWTGVLSCSATQQSVELVLPRSCSVLEWKLFPPSLWPSVSWVNVWNLCYFPKTPLCCTAYVKCPNFIIFCKWTSCLFNYTDHLLNHTSLRLSAQMKRCVCRPE